MSIKQKTFSAIRWTSSASVCKILLHLAQIAILARLLDPEDYGLMAMVTVVLSLTGIISDLGLNSAYVQRKDVTPEERSSLFWLNVLFGCVLTLSLILLSPMISLIFGDLRLTPLLMLASCLFVITALGQQVRINAEKMLDFRPVVLLEITSIMVGFVSAIFAALAKWGVYALIVGQIVTASSATLLAWLFLSRGWRPMWRLQISDIRSYLGFGSALVMNNIANELNRSVDLFLGGRLLGASALGFYSLPRQIVFQIQGLVNPIITRVGFPLIAQIQEDIPRVRSVYLKTLNMTATMNAPIYVAIVFFAPEVVRIMLGERWLDAAGLLRVLALWGFIRSTGNPVGSLLLGMGRADLSMKWNLSMLFVVPPMLWVGSHFGTIGMAFTLLSISILFFIPAWYFLVFPLCGAKLKEYSIETMSPFFLAALSIAPSYLFTVNITNVYLHMIIAGAISAPLYLILNYIFNRYWIESMIHLVMPIYSKRFKKGKEIIEIGEV